MYVTWRTCARVRMTHVGERGGRAKNQQAIEWANENVGMSIRSWGPYSAEISSVWFSPTCGILPNRPSSDSHFAQNERALPDGIYTSAADPA